jgi:hypothetical protein
VAHGFITGLSGSQIKPPALPEVADCGVNEAVRSSVIIEYHYNFSFIKTIFDGSIWRVLGDTPVEGIGLEFKLLFHDWL